MYTQRVKVMDLPWRGKYNRLHRVTRDNKRNRNGKIRWVGEMGVVPKQHGGGASGRAGEAEWNSNGKNNISWPDHPVLSGTIPPTQECTGKDL